MNGWEIALLPIAALAIAAYGLIRRRHEGDPTGGRDVLKCEVTFTDRKQTLEWIETYFDEAQITVIELERHSERSENEDLYTNVYTLRLPQGVSPAALVGRLSGYETVRSVHTGPV